MCGYCIIHVYCQCEPFVIIVHCLDEYNTLLGQCLVGASLSEPHTSRSSYIYIYIYIYSIRQP